MFAQFLDYLNDLALKSVNDIWNTNINNTG